MSLWDVAKGLSVLVVTITFVQYAIAYVVFSNGTTLSLSTIGGFKEPNRENHKSGPITLISLLVLSVLGASFMLIVYGILSFLFTAPVDASELLSNTRAQECSATVIDRMIDECKRVLRLGGVRHE